MAVFIVGGPFPAPYAGQPPVSFIAAALLKPRSRGRVGDRIELNCYDHPSDLPRLWRDSSAWRRPS